jgi:hypothetical protein
MKNARALLDCQNHLRLAGGRAAGDLEVLLMEAANLRFALNPPADAGGSDKREIDKLTIK